MKKLILISLILAAGFTAYPQSSRSSREAKSSKSKSSQVSNRSSSRSNSSKQVKSSSSKPARSQATKAKSSSSKSAVNRSTSNRSSAPKSAARTSSSNNRSSAARTSSSNKKSSAPKSAARTSSSNNRSSAVKLGSSSRSSGAVRSGNSSSRTSRSSAAVRSGNSSARSSGNVKSSASSARTSRSAVKSDRNVLQSTNSRSSVPSKVKNSDRGRAQQDAIKSRSNSSKNVATRSSSNSFDRSNRQGNKTYVSTNGNKYRHQNDEVFTRNRYRTDYNDVRSLRNSRDFIRVHNNYNDWYHRRHVRKVVVHNHFYRPLAMDIRRVRYPYRSPVHFDLCWTPHLHHSFVYYYPSHERWNNISYGDYIETASSYEAMNYVGTVKRVYGKVEEVYYSPEDRTYTLYFGASYPYQDFSVVVPRDVAKSFSWSPSWYFEDEHVWVVGLIEAWEGKPEIVLHDAQQIRRY